MGSPDFAVPVLGALLAAGHEVACVYCQPPRPAGRGYKERPCPVHAFALEKGLAVRTPASLKDPAEEAAFRALNPDLAVVAAYGLILPPGFLQAPARGCLNVHASLLPRWRGAAPIHRALLAGDEETGVTIMKMDAGLDTGPVLLSESVPIAADATANRLHDELSRLGARLMTDALARLDELTPVAQPDAGATYAPKLDRRDGRLDWRQPAADLERRVRALNPWPGAWFTCPAPGPEGKGGLVTIKVLAAEVVAERENQGDPGTVLDDRLTIACGTGALRPTRVQRPGKAATGTDAFLRGYAVAAGTVLP